MLPDGASAFGDWQPVRRQATDNIAAKSGRMGFVVIK
jgi:hypothetical protein